MIDRAFALTALLALAACNTEPDQAATAGNTSATQTDNALIARITSLPPGQLDIVLFRAIRDAGQTCQGIAASRRIDDQGGRPAWSAQCDNGDGRFLLILNPDGQMSVTPGEGLGKR